MKLKFSRCILESSDDLECGIPSVSFTPNGRKLAIATSDRHILLYDEELHRRDRFATKPIDSKYGKKSFRIKCIYFSPDSTKLAVAQTDNIVYVYRLGDSWDEKKVICNKFEQKSSSSSLIWPEENRLIIGCTDGKVRNGSTYSNKCSTLYKTDSMVVTLTQHPNRHSFASGHADGSIIVYSFETRTQRRVCTHSTTPYCLVLSMVGILAAGADRRIIAYHAESGRILQDFDYSRDIAAPSHAVGMDTEFYAAACDMSAQNVIFASFNRLRLLCWNQRRGAWEEGSGERGSVLDLRNLYTVSALTWKPDGTTLVVGNSVGAVIAVDCCMKRALLCNRFSATYVSPSQIIIEDVKSMEGGPNVKGISKCVVRSALNHPITDVRVLNARSNPERHFIVARTAYTLILADMGNSLCSEITWNWSGNERFYLENDNVGMVVNAGEVSFVEYGQNAILGWIRTEKVNPHLISVRVVNSATTERRSPRPLVTNASLSTSTRACRVAYLLDARTISVVNLAAANGAQVAQVAHTNSVDWIELNESATKLLFRDVASSLYLYSLSMDRMRCLVTACSYVQWVPQSDVIVAQSGPQLCVWYNSDVNGDCGGGLNDDPPAISSAQNVVRWPILGDVESVVRDENRTEVIVLENNARVAYELDAAMIEFDAALNSSDICRALAFLERCEQDQQAQDASGHMAAISYDLTPMWSRLAVAALERSELLIAQRCYASLNDVCRVRFVEETIQRAEFDMLKRGQFDALNFGGREPPTSAAIADHFEVRARMALMRKEFKIAESIYVENNALSEAIEMYKRLHQWEAAIELAKSMNFIGLSELQQAYYKHLNDTGQQDKFAEVKASEGDVQFALRLYLDSNRPLMAANMLLENRSQHLRNDEALVETIVEMLIRNGLFEKAGELLEETKRFDRALDCYRHGKAFSKAIRLARFSTPEEVVRLEEQWADTLYADGNFDAAVSHYLEIGAGEKAADSAIRAHEWEKAVEILETLRTGNNAKTEQYYVEIAKHYEAEKDYERAEKLYLDGGRTTDAIEMYNKASRWVDAFKLAAEFFGAEESRALYAEKAETLEKTKRYGEAEELYISIGEPDRAIAMYKLADRNDDMMRLVDRFHNDKVLEMHRKLAEEFEANGDLKSAEEHYWQAGDEAAAVAMYRDAEQWADAYRCAKRNADEKGGGSDGTGAEQKQVLYMWAKSIGGDAAVKLLMRYEMLYEAIDISLSKGDFEFAFDLCGFGASERLPEAQQKYAEYLEDEGDLDKAEELYLKAGKGREAVLMHIHNRNWEAAERIANLNSSAEMLNEVFINRARAALEENDTSTAEGYLLRANRADIIVNYYRETGLWTDALRIAKKYVPDIFEHIQSEYDDVQLRSGAKGAQSYVAQASDWELQGEYRHAVECYLKVTEDVTDDVSMIIYAQAKAAELILKFLQDDAGGVVALSEANDGFVTEPAPLYAGRIVEIGERLTRLQQFSAAGELYMKAGLLQRAVEAFVDGSEWQKARRIAAELSQTAVDFVEERYRASLRKQGRVDDLIDVDVVGAIDLLVERGQWEAALTTAKQQNHRPLLDKYLIAYTTKLIDAEQYAEAARIFVKYGASANTQNFNVYKRIIDSLINERSCGYETYALLRDMVLDLRANFTLQSASKHSEDVVETFERYQYVLHFYALYLALEPLTNAIKPSDIGINNSDGSNSAAVTKLRLQQMLVTLRYVDLLRPDRVFYDAGCACRVMFSFLYSYAKDYGKEYESMAFLLLNHYLDVVDAIEDGDPSLIDNSIFNGTDIPQEYALPQHAITTKLEYDEVKEWVLTASVNQNVTKELKLDDTRHCYEASGIDSTGQTYPICVISGYPIVRGAKELGNNGRLAVDKDQWSLFVNLARTHASDEIFDVQQFITKWADQ